MTTEAKSVRMTYRDACRAAIREALQRDEQVFLMGEDVGRYRWLLCREQRVAGRIWSPTYS